MHCHRRRSVILAQPLPGDNRTAGRIFRECRGYRGQGSAFPTSTVRRAANPGTRLSPLSPGGVVSLCGCGLHEGIVCGVNGFGGQIQAGGTGKSCNTLGTAIAGTITANGGRAGGRAARAGALAREPARQERIPLRPGVRHGRPDVPQQRPTGFPLRPTGFPARPRAHQPRRSLRRQRTTGSRRRRRLSGSGRRLVAGG
jgi:hypothetical protein